MSSTNSRKSLLLILGGILVLALMAVAAIRSGKLPDFIDPSGLLFVFVGGVALPMISFPGNEIRRAFMHAVGTPGSDAEIRISILFWEAAGRGFWILGVLHSVWSVIRDFGGIGDNATCFGSPIYGLRPLLGALYGILMAVICLIPNWRLMGKIQNRPSLQNEERSEALSIGRPGFKYGPVIGYIRFFPVLALTIIILSMSNTLLDALRLVFYWPSLLAVLGGALALMLFICGVNSRPPMSISFAFMGGIGILIGFIQLSFGIAERESVGIASVVEALLFVLSSCFIALLGIILVGAPLEDRAVRTGPVAAAPSAFSRISWYGFPLLILILMPLVIIIMTTPMGLEEQLWAKVHALEEQRSRYEVRTPQSEPEDLMGEDIQKQYLIYKVAPAYPERARREGIHGIVRLNVIVNEEGFVYEVKGNPENNPVLEQAAIPAVKRWRFSPYLMNGMPVAIKTTATVDFASK